MKLTQRNINEQLVVDFVGDFDSRSADYVKSNIRDILANDGSKLVLNLTDVPYIDSAGLGALVSAMKAAKELGGNVILAGLSSQVRMVIEMTRLHIIFEIFDTPDEAVLYYANA